MENVNEELLKKMRTVIAAENGRKGAKAKWDKYPKGSPEREAQVAKLIEARRKKIIHN